jgi:hypothetical protein
MNYNFDLNNNFLDIDSNEISFNNIFVNKILLEYFPNINDKLIFL